MKKITALIISIIVTSQISFADAETSGKDPVSAESSSSCCVDVRGNVNADEFDQTDIVDLIYLINYFYFEGPQTTCFEETDVNRSGEVEIGDIVYLVNYMFNNGPPPFDCHTIGQE